MDESRNLEPVKNREFEIRRKSPFFKTITGVVFVSIVGFSLYTKFRGLTSISWPKIILGTLGIGLFLRYFIYHYSRFNIKTLAKTKNLKEAEKIKMKFDRERDENPLYQRHNSNYGHAEGIESIISTFILYDINFLGNFKCDIYDVENQRAFTS